ncbi:MAG: TPM domain-containing protein [Syntrophales bacterium]|nr:TPM domain-containing protein [Syntrophales bacterium]
MNQIQYCCLRQRDVVGAILAVFVFVLSFCTFALAEDSFPAASGAVNDFAGVIPADAAKRMALLSQEVLEKTGTAVVVVTVRDVGDNEPDMYANELYQAWGIGKKGEDKGVLIFLALRERKIRIETGYGVEGILPDGLVGEILDRYVTPYLKKDDYGTGLENAVAAVSQVAAKDAGITLEGNATVRAIGRTRPDNRGNILPLLLFFLVMLPLLFTRQGRAMLPYLILAFLSGGRGGGSGGFGGFGGGYGGFGGGSSGGGGASRGF